MTNSGANAEKKGDASLLRALGPNMAIALVVGNVIGSGIFLKPGNIAGATEDFALIISVWIFGGVLCILGALCFAELATMLPEAGGPYVYLRQAYGKLVAFLYGWTELLFARPASIGALAVAFVGSFTLALQWNASAWTIVALAAGLILGMAWVNVMGVVWGGRLQLATTVVKTGFLLLVALSPLLLAPFVSTTIDLENYRSSPLPEPVPLATQIGAVLLAVMWAYDGWHGVTPLAEEIQHPQRNIPLALFGGIGLLIALYVAANIAYHGVLSIDEMRGAGDHAAELMMFKLAGRAGQSAIAIVIMCSTFGAINSNILLAPRITFAMGRDGVFFRSLGQVHATYRTPVVAILVTAAMAVSLIITIAAGKWLVAAAPGVTEIQATADKGLFVAFKASLRDDSTFELLTNLVVFANSVFYMLSVLALIVLRFREPERNRPYRTWGYPFVPIVFLVVYAWFLAQVYTNTRLESRAGIAAIMIGIPVFFAYQAFTRTAKQTSAK